MAKDVADVLGTAIGRAAREAAKNISHTSRKPKLANLNGSKGLAAGAGLAALVPIAAKGAGRLVGGKDGGSKSKSKSKSEGVPGVGKGRRMPIQQDIDIGAPIKVVWDKWTSYEDWPQFMHRLDNVSQEGDKKISFKTKIWGISKEFRAKIVEQVDGERIKWEVTDGVTHTGVVTFHELGPRLTRIEVNIDVEPGSLIEKAARGMRHVKRAVRADMARFKAYALMEDDSGRSRSSPATKRASSSSGRKRSSTRKRSATTKSRSSSNGRSSSSRTRASSNGRSSSARKRTSSSRS